MIAFILRCLSLYGDPPKDAAQQARNRVNAELRRSVPDTILCQARARAVRLIVGGCGIDDAVTRAVKWARSCDHSQPVVELAR